jgi:putative hydrolase of the HAD superfamily
MIKAVIFDLDNTLVDFMKVKRRSVEAAAEAMVDAGFKTTSKKTLERIYKMYDREGIEDQRVFDKLLVEEYGEIDYRILAAGILAYRKAKEGSMFLYPHVRRTLTELVRHGIKLAIVSDAPRLSAWMRLVGFGIEPYFDVVVSYDDTGFRKPNPAPFRRALEKMKVEPEEAIMIGDWVERDMVGAKALGMTTVLARYGDSFDTKNTKTKVADVDHAIDDIEELIEIVKKLSKGHS